MNEEENKKDSIGNKLKQAGKEEAKNIAQQEMLFFPKEDKTTFH